MPGSRNAARPAPAARAGIFARAVVFSLRRAFGLVVKGEIGRFRQRGLLSARTATLAPGRSEHRSTPLPCLRRCRDLLHVLAQLGRVQRFQQRVDPCHLNVRVRIVQKIRKPLVNRCSRRKGPNVRSTARYPEDQSGAPANRRVIQALAGHFGLPLREGIRSYVRNIADIREFRLRLRAGRHQDRQGDGRRGDNLHSVSSSQVWARIRESGRRGPTNRGCIEAAAGLSVQDSEVAGLAV